VRLLRMWLLHVPLLVGLAIHSALVLLALLCHFFDLVGHIGHFKLQEGNKIIKFIRNTTALEFF